MMLLFKAFDYNITNKHKMKPSELRIGNLVKKENGSEDGRVVTVFDIQQDCINIDDTSDGSCPMYWFDGDGSIQGIPITEEWLLKFGFKEGSHDHSWTFENLHGTLEKQTDGWDLLDYEINNMNTTPILYIHQLQNICFCLTGEEL